MLKSNTKFEKNETISIKLSSGEEVTARFKEDKDDTLNVQYPMVLVPHPSGGVVFQQWMFTGAVSQIYEIRKANITSVQSTEKEFEKNYNDTVLQHQNSKLG